MLLSSALSASLFDAPGAAAGTAAAPARSDTEPLPLPPAVWRAHQLGRAATPVLASGFDELDAELPGGGWPLSTLTELLLPHAGIGELRLLAPVQVAQQREQRCLMWFDPPAAPCAWALSALGIDMRQLVVVRSRQTLNEAPRAGLARPAPRGGLSSPAKPALLRSRAREHLPAADVLWALEQTLKSGHVGVVLAWLPARLPADALRRLQLAAQAHGGLVFLLRDAALRTQPSPAPLRLLLASAGPDQLRVGLLKRRGPPLAQPLTLALPAVLSAPVLARAKQPAPQAVPTP